jgi:hypothetical protein
MDKQPGRIPGKLKLTVELSGDEAHVVYCQVILRNSSSSDETAFELSMAGHVARGQAPTLEDFAQRIPAALRAWREGAGQQDLQAVLLGDS